MSTTPAISSSSNPPVVKLEVLSKDPCSDWSNFHFDLFTRALNAIDPAVDDPFVSYSNMRVCSLVCKSWNGSFAQDELFSRVFPKCEWTRDQLENYSRSQNIFRRPVPFHRDYAPRLTQQTTTGTPLTKHGRQAWEISIDDATSITWTGNVNGSGGNILLNFMGDKSTLKLPPEEIGDDTIDSALLSHDKKKLILSNSTFIIFYDIKQKTIIKKYETDYAASLWKSETTSYVFAHFPFGSFTIIDSIQGDYRKINPNNNQIHKISEYPNFLQLSFCNDDKYYIDLKGTHDSDYFQKISDAFKEHHHLTTFNALDDLPEKTKEKIYGKFYKAHKPFPNDYYGCAEDAFHCRNGQSSTYLQRANVVIDVAKDCNKESKALFNTLDTTTQEKIYGELCKIKHLEEMYSTCAEHAFHCTNEQSSTPKERAQAIDNFIRR